MKETVEKSIRENRIIAIIRGFEPDLCLKLAEAYLKGGIRNVEVTYVQTDRALWRKTTDAISAIASRFKGELCIGAGTVLSSEQLKMTRDAGGMFMVSPNEKPELIRECVSLGLAAVPGAFSPTEVVSAWEAGASFVKVFPAGTLGPGYIKALKAPLKHIPMLAVGGVTPDNVVDFIKAGCIGVAVSGVLQNKEWMDAGEWGKITDVAKTLVERAKS